MTVFNLFTEFQGLMTIEKRQRLTAITVIRDRHRRSITTPADEITDLVQNLQPRTGYGTDAGLQAVLLGKLHEIRHWVKSGLTWKIINIPIDHNFTYRRLP